MNRSRQRGFTLLEVIVSTSIFVLFLAVAFTLTSEMRGWEKRLPVNFMRHPEIMGVLARMRRDVLDVHVPPGPNPTIYLSSYEDGTTVYRNGDKTLILLTLLPNGGVQTIVWDFSTPGEARRLAFNVGQPAAVWTARGLPEDFSPVVDAAEFPDRPFGVRLIAKDMDGKVALDQILQPRAHH